MCGNLPGKSKWYIHIIRVNESELFWQKELFTLLSSSVGETRWNACRECGNSRGARGSQGPSLGVFILITMCQLKVDKMYSPVIPELFKKRKRKKRYVYTCQSSSLWPWALDPKTTPLKLYQFLDFSFPEESKQNKDWDWNPCHIVKPALRFKGNRLFLGNRRFTKWFYKFGV